MGENTIIIIAGGKYNYRCAVNAYCIFIYTLLKSTLKKRSTIELITSDVKPQRTGVPIYCQYRSVLCSSQDFVTYK